MLQIIGLLWSYKLLELIDVEVMEVYILIYKKIKMVTGQNVQSSQVIKSTGQFTSLWNAV